MINKVSEASKRRDARGTHGTRMECVRACFVRDYFPWMPVDVLKPQNKFSKEFGIMKCHLIFLTFHNKTHTLQKYFYTDKIIKKKKVNLPN
jgi:hypothetical protein